MYTTLRRGYVYLINDEKYRYLDREFPPDSPPTFSFVSELGVLQDFQMHHLTTLEQGGLFRVMDPQPLAGEWATTSEQD